MHDDAPGAVLELLGAGLHVDHQVAVGLAERIIAIVVSMLSTIFVAVPAFSRVDPAMTSGPTAGAICRSTKVCSSVPGRR